MWERQEVEKERRNWCNYILAKNVKKFKKRKEETNLAFVFEGSGLFSSRGFHTKRKIGKGDPILQKSFS